MGPRFSNPVLQTLMVLMAKRPPKVHSVTLNRLVIRV